MWQTPSVYNESTSFPIETDQQAEEGSGPPAPSADPANSGILPSSPPGLILYRVPVVTSSLVSQLLPNDSLLDMNSNIQETRRRGQRRRRVCESRRVRPYRTTNLDVFIDRPQANCDLQNLEVDINVRNQEQSFSAVIKRRGDRQNFEDYMEQEEREDRTSLPDSENGSRSFSPNPLQMIADGDSVILIPPVSDSEDNAIENFSSSLLHLSPVSSVTQTENVLQSSTPSDQMFLESVSESPLDSMEGDCTGEFELTRTTPDVSSSQPFNSHSLPVRQKSVNPIVSSFRIIPELPPPTINAQKLANNLIKLSRYLKSPNFNDICCPNCRHIPILPVTGQCGHTRCMRCILLNGSCPCGVNAPKSLFVNTVIREIVEKMSKYIRNPRILDPETSKRTHENIIPLTGAKPRYLVKRGLQCRSRTPRVANFSYTPPRPRIPMTVQARYRRARELVRSGRYAEASSHLARVAASSESYARPARHLLAQTVSALCEGRERAAVSRELSHAVREQAAHSWLGPSDLECVLCTNTYTNPVSTPCGHTYCRTCVERALYYKKKCALCLGPLENFRLAETRDTVFISSILTSIDVSPLPEETDVIPVVTCYVAFPGMPCPLFIFDRRYWLMVRRVLQSGARRFGMLAYEKGHTFADYGTVLEICDCVVLEDSRCIVSTVGVSRFRVIERHIKDGCDVARIQPLTDIMPTEDEVQDLHILASQISCKAIAWLKNMDEAVREEIETAFGTLPYDDRPDDWWKTADGPNWLWWLIAILPLKSEIKILILSTRSLLKRMLAVSRTLDVMDSDSFTSANPTDEPPLNELANQEWLRRTT